MVQKVNGTNKQGAWFERDTCIVTVTANAGTPFSLPAEVVSETTGDAEKVMRVMQTRGTVIGYCVESDTVAHFMFGHAAGVFNNDSAATMPDVLGELEAELNKIGTPQFDRPVAYQGFKGFESLSDQLESNHDDAHGKWHR